MHKIGPCLWFDNQAEEAAAFYVSTFANSRMLDSAVYLEGMPGPAGSTMVVRFMLDGVEFEALNGGPVFQFTPAISLVVTVDTQAEVDRLWDRMTSDGGEESQCGWLLDKFGVSWQIVPTALGEMLGSSDTAAAQRAAVAMLAMKKLDIAALREAFENA